jgi:hypothetical protein
MIRVLALCLLAGASANAVAIVRYGNVNAAGVCQAPSPVYDQSLRKTAFVIRNVGTSAVFVSCSAPNHAYSGSREISVTVKNPLPSEVQFNCTLADGAHSTDLNDAIYISKSMVIPPYTVTDMRWNSHLDNGDTMFWRVNFTCILPPGVEIGEISNVWEEDIGS